MRSAREGQGISHTIGGSGMPEPAPAPGQPAAPGPPASHALDLDLDLDLDRLVDDPPIHLVAAIGRPLLLQLSGDEQRLAAWRQTAATVQTYRARHDLHDPTRAVGPPPDDPAEQAEWYGLIEQIRRYLGDLEPAGTRWSDPTVLTVFGSHHSQMERQVARDQVLDAALPQLPISPEIQAHLVAAPNAELCARVSAALNLLEQQPAGHTPQHGPLARQLDQLAHSRADATAALIDAQQRLADAKGVTNWAVRRQLQAEVAVHHQALDRIVAYQRDHEVLAAHARAVHHEREQWEMTNGPALACGRLALIELDQREAEALLELQHDPPAYLTELGPPAATSRWHQTAIRVQCYRSANDITDADHPLGPEPPDPTARWEWRRLSLECTQLRIAAADQRGLPPPTATARVMLDELGAEGPAPFPHG